MVRLAQILLGNTLIYFSYKGQKSSLYVKFKIVFEAHEETLRNKHFVLHFLT